MVAAMMASTRPTASRGGEPRRGRADRRYAVLVGTPGAEVGADPLPAHDQVDAERAAELGDAEQPGCNPGDARDLIAGTAPGTRRAAARLLVMRIWAATPLRRALPGQRSGG